MILYTRNSFSSCTKKHQIGKKETETDALFMKMSPLHQHEKRTQAPATVVNTLFPDNLYTTKPINASHEFAKYCIIQVQKGK